jgi:hypothetical protein
LIFKFDFKNQTLVTFDPLCSSHRRINKKGCFVIKSLFFLATIYICYKSEVKLCKVNDYWHLSHLHTVVLWLICRHREIGNSTYMKVILTKNLTFFNIIYHTKFQFAKMSVSLGNWHILTPFLVHKRHRNLKNYIFFIVLDIFSNWNCVW